MCSINTKTEVRLSPLRSGKLLSPSLSFMMPFLMALPQFFAHRVGGRVGFFLFLFMMKKNCNEKGRM